MIKQKALSQWETPIWAARAIVSHALSDLAPGARVLEPSCGSGNIISALPAELEVVGVEIDPAMAAKARKNTSATIIEGDFRTVDLPHDHYDAIVGNPPFVLDVFDAMLARSVGLLDYGSSALFILPAYAFQTSSRVVRWNKDWTIAQDMLPRGLFPGIRLPLTLARFIRERNTKLHGFLLYHQSHEVESLDRVYREALANQKSGWRAVVKIALEKLGGEAKIEDIYGIVAPKRPTATNHWREKIRQQLQDHRHFCRVDKGRYALLAA